MECVAQLRKWTHKKRAQYCIEPHQVENGTKIGIRAQYHIEPSYQKRQKKVAQYRIKPRVGLHTQGPGSILYQAKHWAQYRIEPRAWLDIVLSLGPGSISY